MTQLYRGNSKDARALALTDTPRRAGPPGWPRRPGRADLAAPLTGTVCAHNDDLPPTPELVNADPCGQGLDLDAEIDIDPATLDQQLAGFMDARAYQDLAGD